MKMAMFAETIRTFHSISIKIPTVFLREIDNTILKEIWRHKMILRAQTTINIKEDAAPTTKSNFKLYLKAIVIKTK